MSAQEVHLMVRWWCSVVLVACGWVVPDAAGETMSRCRCVRSTPGNWEPGIGELSGDCLAPAIRVT